VFVLLLTLLWRERNQPVELPIPTGTFAVGRAIYDWIDHTTVDTLAPVPGTKRELLVWIWYPSDPGQSGTPDDYVPAQMRAAIGPAQGLMSYVTRDVSKVRRIVFANPDLPAQPKSYPVVIIRAGASAGVVG